MNSLFEVANIYLHYRGGKHVGLAGLIGVLVAIIVILAWNDWIQPVVNFVGLDTVADNIGITVDGPGGAAATAYNVIIIYIFLCIALSLIVGLGLIAFVFGNVALRSNIGGVIIGLLIFTVLSPILIWSVFGKSLKHNKGKAVRSNGQTVEDKHKDFLDYIWKEKGNSPSISHKEAVRYLHRFPTRGKNEFLVGITRAKEVVLLFPRPFGTVIYGTNHKFIGAPLNYEKFIPNQHDPYGVGGSQNPHCYYVQHEEEVITWNTSDIESILSPEGIPDIQLAANNLSQRLFYKEYADRVKSHYELNKNQDYVSNEKEEVAVMSYLS